MVFRETGSFRAEAACTGRREFEVVRGRSLVAKALVFQTGIESSNLSARSKGFFAGVA